MTPSGLNVGGDAHIIKNVFAGGLSTPEIITTDIKLPTSLEEGEIPTVLTNNNITTPSLTASGSITAPKYILSESDTKQTEVLVPTIGDSQQAAAVITVMTVKAHSQHKFTAR